MTTSLAFEEVYVELQHQHDDDGGAVFVSLYWMDLLERPDQLTDETQAAARALAWLAADFEITYRVNERCAYVGVRVQGAAEQARLVERCREMKQALLNGDFDRPASTLSDIQPDGG